MCLLFRFYIYYIAESTNEARIVIVECYMGQIHCYQIHAPNGLCTEHNRFIITLLVPKPIMC
jgi:putative methionine-R-sulfoxide reductase with GAF domain